MTSPTRLARIAGLLYLIVVTSGGFAYRSMLTQVDASDDAICHLSTV